MPPPSTTLSPRVVKAGTTALVALGLVVSLGTVAGASSAALNNAKKQLLTLANMPKGWKTEPGTTVNTNQNSHFPGANQLGACVGVSPSLFTSNPPVVNSPVWQDSKQAFAVEESISIFSSTTVARQEFGAIANAKTPGCLQTVTNTAAIKSQLASTFGTGVTVGTVTVAPTNLGKNTAGFTLTVPASYQGQSQTVYFTTVVFIKGKEGGELSLNSDPNPFATATAKHIVSVAQSKL
jgi:hypothetical protein